MQSSHCGAYTTVQILFIKNVNQDVLSNFKLSAIKIQYLKLVNENFIYTKFVFAYLVHVYRFEHGTVDIFWSRVLDEDDL